MTLNTTTGSTGSAVETWLDNNYVSLAPTRVEGEFSTDATTTMTTDEPVTIKKVKIILSYTLELFSGGVPPDSQRVPRLLRYDRGSGSHHEDGRRTGVVEQISGDTFKFTGAKDGSVVLPNTPTPTTTTNIVFGKNAPILQVANKGNVAEVYLNTNGQAKGVASFQLEFMTPIFITGAAMNMRADKFTLTTSDNKIIGVQMASSDDTIEMTAPTTTLMMTINLGSGSVATLNASTSTLVDKTSASLDMSSIRVAETPHPRPRRRRIRHRPPLRPRITPS